MKISTKIEVPAGALIFIMSSCLCWWVNLRAIMLTRVLSYRPFKQKNNLLEGKQEAHRINGDWRTSSAKGQDPRESWHWCQTTLPSTQPVTRYPNSHWVCAWCLPLQQCCRSPSPASLCHFSKPQTIRLYPSARELVERQHGRVVRICPLGPVFLGLKI